MKTAAAAAAAHAGRPAANLGVITCVSSGSVCGGTSESVAAATGTAASGVSGLSCGEGPVWDWRLGSDPCPGRAGSAFCGDGKR